MVYAYITHKKKCCSFKKTVFGHLIKFSGLSGQDPLRQCYAGFISQALHKNDLVLYIIKTVMA